MFPPRLGPGAALALLALGCSAGVDVRPPARSGAALAVVLDANGQAIALEAVARDAPLPALYLNPEERALLLLYPGDLPTLGLEPGPVLVRSGGRSVPTSSAALELDVETGRWTSIPHPTDLMAQLRLPPLEPCPDRGCVRWLDDALVCELPCPAPPEPDAPRPAEAPRLPARDCPPGTVPDGPACRAPGDGDSCAAGSYRPIHTDACLPFLECTADRFRGEELDLYVDAASALPGDGSRERPFGDLHAALEVAAEDARIGLAAGSYTLTRALDRSVTLVGACPSEVGISARLQVPSDTELRVDGVALLLGSSQLDGQLRATNTTFRIGRSGRLGSGPQGRLELSHSSLAMLEGGGVNGGRVRLEDVQLRVSGDGPAAFEAAAFEAHQTRIDVRLRPLVSTSAPPVLLDRVFGVAQLGLRLSGTAEARLERSYLEVTEGLRLSEQARARLENAGLQGNGLLARLDGEALLQVEHGLLQVSENVVAVRLDDASRAELTGVRLDTAGPAVWLADTASLRAMDSGFRTGSLAVIAVDSAQVHLERVSSHGAMLIGPSTGDGMSRSGRRPCRLSSAPAAPVGRAGLKAIDLIMQEATYGVVGCPASVVEVARYAAHHVEVPLLADCRFGCELDDEVSRVSAMDLDLDGAEGDIGVMQRGGRLTLERAHIRGFQSAGLYVWGSAVAAHHLRISDIADASVLPDRLDSYCSANGSETDRGSGSGVMVEDWAQADRYISSGTLVLRDFLLRDNQCSGLSIGVAGAIELQSGQVLENRRGLNFLRFNEPAVAEDVVFRGNLQGPYYNYVE